MRYEQIYVAGTGVSLPALMPVEEAVTAGRCQPAIAKITDSLSVAVSPQDQPPADFAVTAARLACARAGRSAGDIDLLLHATVYYQGQDLWAAASYIQRHAAIGKCPAIEIRQLSNGGMAALELAAGYLTAAGGRSAALITAADAFRPPGFDRWNSDPGTIYGDGGVALVLSTRGGFALLRSLVSVSDPDLEGMHRGDDPFGDVPFSCRRPMDLAAWKDAFVARSGKSFTVARTKAGLRSAIAAALREAGSDLDGIDWFIVPHFGRRRLEVGLLLPLGIGLQRTTWERGRRVGHLGAGDQVAGLDYLIGAGQLRPGQRCLLIGIGAGFTWSCAVLEILAEPSRQADSTAS